MLFRSQVVGERDVAGVDAAILVVHDDIDGEPVILKQFAVFWQGIKLLNLTRRLSDAPAHQDVKLHTTLLADLYQTADIQPFHQRHHRHGRRRPQPECLRTAAFLGGYFSLHTFLVYALQ